MAVNPELVLNGVNGNDSAGTSLTELGRRLENHLEDADDTSRVQCKLSPSAFLASRLPQAVVVYNEMR